MYSNTSANEPEPPMNQKQKPAGNSRSFASSNPSQRAGRISLLPKKVDSTVPCVSSPVQNGTQNGGSRTKDNRQAIDTPVKAFLSSNITPRSSSRKARAESASSTPNGTPSGTPSNSRPSSMIYTQDRESERPNDFTGLGTRRPSIGHTVRSSSISSDRQSTTSSFRSAPGEREFHSAKAMGLTNNPKFFHADDIRPTLASIPSERVIEQGAAYDPSSPGVGDERASRARPGSSPPLDELRPKFFYANDVAGSTPLPKTSTSRTIKAPYPIHTGASSITSPAPQQQRATSPLKEEIVSRKSSLSKPRRHTRLVSNPNVGLELDLRSPESSSINQSNISRRSSLRSQGTPQNIHARSSSVGAAAPIPVRSGSGTCSEGPTMDSPTIYIAAGPEAVNDTEQAAPTLYEHSQAGKSVIGQSKLDHMNELAANARRERKVLDLEISNASLLAINRTLEHEMRKQSAELRRFRRRSQPGRRSIAPASRSTSHAISILSNSDQVENGSEVFSDDSSPSVFSDDDEDSNDDASEHSPSSNTSQHPSGSFYASRVSRLRDKDAKRIQLDLARHRELLVDSQKLNESIKRCLGRTEDLIADGKKALDYHVQTGGVETHGGRVLLPDELEDGEIVQHGQGLLSPGVSDKRGMEWELGKESKPDDEDQDECSVGADENHESREAQDETLSIPDDPTATVEHDLPEVSEPNTLPPNSESPPQSPPRERNSWDHARAHVRSPDEPITTPGLNGGVQGIKEYLAILGPAWGL